jgi:hypothetical protein
MTPSIHELPSTTRDVRDDRGAVMVIGLFMALALIAVIWVVIGFGEAIVLRDRTQEVADSAAYTNAVIHARGMNFIVLINVLLMALCLVYVAVTFIDFVLSIVLGATGVWENFPPTCFARYGFSLFGLDLPWCQIARFVQNIEDPVYKFDQKYFDLYKRVANPLFETQTWAALVVPWLGSLSSLETGTEFDSDRVALSWSLSLIPGGGAPNIGPIPLNVLQKLMDRVPLLMRPVPGKSESSNIFQDRRIGLPMEAEPAYAFCIRGARFGMQAIQTAMYGWNLGGTTLESWTQQEPISTVMYFIMQSVGEWTRLFFCSEKKIDVAAYTTGAPNLEYDVPKNFLALFMAKEAMNWFFVLGMGPWTKDNTQNKFYFQGDDFWRQTQKNIPDPKANAGYFFGPKRMSIYAYNGSDWMQVWGAALQNTPSSTPSEIVSMPARLFSKQAPSGPATGGSPWFWSEAEFYFDCTSVWQSSYCNKGSAAAYQMNFRARLRRIHEFNVFGDLIEVFVDNAVFGTIAKNAARTFTPLKHLSLEWLSEGIIKAVRNDVSKLVNKRVFAGDRSSNEILH